jgi:hypothetical protein
MDTIHILDEKKRWGVKILLDWVVSEFKLAQNDIDKGRWRVRISFLEELQRKTHYNETDKLYYNKIRTDYLHFVTN